MADMGKLALQMSLNPGTFEQDIKRSIAQVQSLGATVAHLGSGSFSISGALSQLPGVVGMSVTAIAGLGTAFVAAGARASPS